MAQKRKPHMKSSSGMGVVAGRKKKEKGKTQKHNYTMVMVMGPSGKTHMEKRPC